MTYQKLDQPRLKMTITAIVGAISFSLFFGFYAVMHSDLSVPIWSISGVLIGIIVGIVAQIPTNHHRKSLRLLQAIIQGGGRGALVGAIVHLFALTGEYRMIQEGLMSDPLIDVFSGLRSFVFCGACIGFVFMWVTVTSKTAQESARRHNFLKSAFAVVAIISVVLSLIIAVVLFLQPLFA